MMKEFFFGAGNSYLRKMFESLNNPLPIMQSYATKEKEIKHRKLLFIDSGGFSFFTKVGDYETPHTEYLDFVRSRNADFFANRDYPCEDSLLKKHNVGVKDNQDKTIKNQIEIMDLLDTDYSDLKGQFVAVIQGNSIESYLRMIDIMKEQGLFTPLSAVGTLCKRQSTGDIRSIIKEIKNNVVGGGEVAYVWC